MNTSCGLSMHSCSMLILGGPHILHEPSAMFVSRHIHKCLLSKTLGPEYKHTHTLYGVPVWTPSPRHYTAHRKHVTKCARMGVRSISQKQNPEEPVK